MECNKDDALRAKKLAEKKLLEMDLAGAKRFALKAQELYPGLDGLPHLLATLEVYISAEKRINGEIDWYRVLGVDPLADDETIRRHYRKMALTLHPDKNKSVGSDEAFKLISQAWSLFSDKGKKVLYDQRCNLRGSFEEVSNGKPSVPASQNGFFNIFNTANWKARDHTTAVHANPAPASPVSLKQSFWTRCGACRTHFEYPTVYINCNLMCNRCHKPFLAIEVPHPTKYRNASHMETQKRKFKQTTMEENGYFSGRTPTSSMNSLGKLYGSRPFYMPGGVVNVPTPSSSTAEAPSDFGVSSDHLKRARDSTSPPTMRGMAHYGKTHSAETIASNSASQSSFFGSNSVLKEDQSRKKRSIDEHSDRREVETKMASQSEKIRLADENGPQKGGIGMGRVNPVGNYKRNGMRDMSQQKLKMLLMEKARKDIRSKLKELNFDCVSGNLDKSKKPDRKVKEKENEKSRNGVEKVQGFVDSDTTVKKPSYVDPDISNLEVVDSLSMSVPDPDFHNFDNDRTEKSFGENQVWAAYDDDDGMPRYYAMIHGVISFKPFKMRMSWLNSKSNDELAPIKWVSYGFPKTSGDFWIGKHEFNGSLNSFSHRVKWTKGARGVVQIYPMKGDVWALYRNWSLDWNELTLDEIVQKYDMVEVLEDYNEKRGVNVAPLVKVPGFKTVFHRHADPRKIRNIAREEMFRFSHQVPCYSLTGQDGHNAPPGCLELDPAAVPMELLQVVTEEPKQETVATVENSSEVRLRARKIPRDGDFVEIDLPTKEERLMEGVPMRKKSRLENLIVYRRKRVREKKALQVASNCELLN